MISMHKIVFDVAECSLYPNPEPSGTKTTHFESRFHITSNDL